MIIAILTDFGTSDYFVGAMKGVIFSVNEAAKIVDITHEIPPQDISAASFTLRACYKNFPRKTVFLTVVDPGVGTNRRAILVETDDYYFIAPDNGLLSFVFQKQNFKVFELTNKEFFAETVSRTFHGRDVFAPVAAHLSKGVEAGEFGAEINDFICLKPAKPRTISAQESEAEVIHIDRFGNLITNLKEKDLPSDFVLEINGKTINRLQNSFAEAESDDAFMIWGSAGFLEICVFQNSAANRLKAKIGQIISVRKTS